jgi:hypothetical protein
VRGIDGDDAGTNFSCAKGNLDAPFWKMTVSCGLHSRRALKEWVQETLEMLQGMEP